MAISVQMCRIAVSQLFGRQHNPPRIVGTRITIAVVEVEDPRTATIVVVPTAYEPRTRRIDKAREIAIPGCVHTRNYLFSSIS